MPPLHEELDASAQWLDVILTRLTIESVGCPALTNIKLEQVRCAKASQPSSQRRTALLPEKHKMSLDVVHALLVGLHVLLSRMGW